CIKTHTISSFLRKRTPLDYPLFPYTTLFRSVRSVGRVSGRGETLHLAACHRHLGGVERAAKGEALSPAGNGSGRGRGDLRRSTRSEEHTSELQSRENLVCRLLLEKKKFKQKT